MSAYNHLNISDNLLSSSTDPLVSFNEPASIFSESPFSSSSDSSDLRLLAVLLYKSDTQSQSAAKESSSSSSSSSSKGVLSEIANLLDGETQETHDEFDWNAWAADMNANPLSRTDFDISDFATKAGLGTPVAAEVLIIKDEDVLTDSLDAAGSWDIVSTLYQTGASGNAAGTATAMGPIASGIGAGLPGTGAPATGARAGPAGLGLMPSGGAAASDLGAAVAAATGIPLTSTDPDSESDKGTGAGPVAASDSPGSNAGDSQSTNASPSGSSSSGNGGSSSGGLAVIPVASNSTLGSSASTGSPLNATGPISTSDSGSDDSCDDDDDGNDSAGAGVASGGSSLPLTAATQPTGAALLTPSGRPKQPQYPGFPQYSGAASGVRPLINATAVGDQGNAAGTTPTRSAAGAGITGGGKAAAAHGEQVTIDIDIGGDFETVRISPPSRLAPTCC